MIHLWAGAGARTSVEIVVEGDGVVGLRAVEPRLETVLSYRSQLDLSTPASTSGAYSVFDVATIDPETLPHGPLEVSLTLPYEVFDRLGRERSSTAWEGYQYGVMALLYWADLDGDGLGDGGEYYVLSVDERAANAFRIQLSNLGEDLAEARAALGVAGEVEEALLVRLALAGLSPPQNPVVEASVEVLGLSWRESGALMLPEDLTVDGRAWSPPRYRPPPRVSTPAI
ncbi:hypothetical protein [Aeropyrum camini]|uniref:hypothetical protein n=1 Tax=Aeropyrum camini TaxID=229980 RepID=UPI000787B3CB|nr:hypothetical protein [Aeropyrum camini]